MLKTKQLGHQGQALLECTGGGRSPEKVMVQKEETHCGTEGEGKGQERRAPIWKAQATHPGAGERSK